MNTFDLSWDDIASAPTTERLEFLKIQPGKVGARVRVVSAPALVDQHWSMADGHRRKVNCAGPNCVLCSHGEKPSQRYCILVLDKTDKPNEPTLKVYEAPKSVMMGIKAYYQDEDYGDPKGYDIKIKKEGAGKETRYTVVGGKHSDLTSEELEMIKNAPSLKDLCQPATNDYIQSLGFDALKNSENSGINEDTTVTPTDDFEEGTPKKTEAPKPTPTSGSEDDWDDF